MVLVIGTVVGAVHDTENETVPVRTGLLMVTVPFSVKYTVTGHQPAGVVMQSQVQL